MTVKRESDSTHEQLIRDIVFRFRTSNHEDTEVTLVDDGVSIHTAINSDFKQNSVVCIERSVDGSEAPNIHRVIQDYPEFNPDRTICVVSNSELQLSAFRAQFNNQGITTMCVAGYLDWHLRPEFVLKQLETGKDRRGNDVLIGAGASDLLSPIFVRPNAKEESTGEERIDLIAHLTSNWAKGKDLRFIVIHAPAGHGKSMFSHQLGKQLAETYRQHKEWEKPALPLLIAFGNFRRGSSSFSGLVLDRLQRDGAPRLTIDGFKDLTRLRRVNLILDGFDEMIESSAEVARSNIQDFVLHAGEQARIVLTSRSTFFKSRSDVADQLNSMFLQENEIEVMELQPFTDAQINTYVFEKQEPKLLRQSAEKIARRIKESADINDMARSPLILKEIVRIEKEQGFGSRELEKKTVIDLLVEKSLIREQSRMDFDFSIAEQKYFLEELALELLRYAQPNIDFEDLGTLAEIAIDRIKEIHDKETVITRLRNHYYLTPAPGTTGRLSMHVLWREYFQAQGISRLLAKPSPNVDKFKKILSMKLLSPQLLKETAKLLELDTIQTLQFSHTTTEFANNWLRLVMELSDDTEVITKLMDKVGGFQGRQFVNIVFTGRDLRGLNFSNSIFDNCQFVGCDLQQVNFTDVLLQGVTLRKCKYDKTIASAIPAGLQIDGVDYSHAELVAKMFSNEPSQSRNTEAPPVRESGDMSLRALFHTRLELFVTVTADGSRPILKGGNTAASALVRGVNKKFTNVIRRKIVPAMTRSGLIESVPGRESFKVSPDARSEVLEYIHKGTEGSRIKRALTLIQH
jgi:hypothetical protein